MKRGREEGRREKGREEKRRREKSSGGEKGEEGIGDNTKRFQLSSYISSTTIMFRGTSSLSRGCNQQLEPDSWLRKDLLLIWVV